MKVLHVTPAELQTMLRSGAIVGATSIAAGYMGLDALGSAGAGAEDVPRSSLPSG